ncbi:MAG: hypothetical protein ACWA6X_12075 [Bauldia sp.]
MAFLDMLEQPMSARKKQYAHTMSSDNGERPFPPEAYAYDDDITAEAVQTVRGKANDRLENAKWEVVDGFGFSIDA